MAAALLLPAAAYCLAGEEGEESPIVVTADTLVADNKTHTVTYSENVVVTRGDITLTAPRVVISLVETDKGRDTGGGPTDGMFGGSFEVRTIEATGGVKVIQEDKTAVSDKARYDFKDQTIIMEGSPRVWQGPNVLTGKRIIIDLKDDTISVEGARTIIYTEEPVPGVKETEPAGR